MINVSLPVFERELFCIMAETQYIQAEMFTNPLSNIPSGERTKHFQHVHTAPSQEEEKRPAPACQQNGSLCSVRHYEIAVGDIALCKTTCILCNIPVISHWGETSLPMYNNQYTLERLRCFVLL